MNRTQLWSPVYIQIPLIPINFEGEQTRGKLHLVWQYNPDPINTFWIIHVDISKTFSKQFLILDDAFNYIKPTAVLCYAEVSVKEKL